ncbi:MAG: tetratricopeptide repeat protein, partial [Chitinophagales bacterium]
NKTQTGTIQQPTKRQNTYRKLDEFKQYRTYSHPIVETSKAYTLVFIIVFFTLLAMAPFVYMLLPIHFSTEKIFQSHFTPHPMGDVDRKFNNNVFASFNWQEGVEAYKEKNYDETIYLLNDLLENENSHTDAFIDHFYLGVSYLGIEKPDGKAAIIHFNEILEDNTPTISDWKSPTHWYLALSYLQLNKTQNTRKHLKEIIAEGDDAYHYQKALKLLEEI